MEKVALEINGPITDPVRFMADLRKHAPHLFTDGKDVPVPPPAAARKRPALEVEPLLTPQELGRMLKVDPKTATRWANQGKIHTVRTIGNHRRFYLREVQALIRGETWEPAGGWPPNSLA